MTEEPRRREDSEIRRGAPRATPASRAGAQFVALGRRLKAERQEARDAWTAHRITAELHTYVERIPTFESGALAAEDAARGLQIRREFVEACASRPNTARGETLALAPIAELIGAVHDSLAANGDVHDPTVATALAILQHEIMLSFVLGD